MENRWLELFYRSMALRIYAEDELIYEENSTENLSTLFILQEGAVKLVRAEPRSETDDSDNESTSGGHVQPRKNFDIISYATPAIFGFEFN